MLIVQEDEEEEDEELEDELLDCLMCRNETLVDFLRKHIKFHHMIQVWTNDQRTKASGGQMFIRIHKWSTQNVQEDSIVEKLFNMHFPSEYFSWTKHKSTS